ncbi:DNRLRE domain-containing protein, partial [candidate division KSB3 bacterium]|nr:DNRLRE domain-containing protein [candidate division KSB3 bacterium]
NTDIYISSAYPDTSYNSSTQLKVGRYDASTGHCRTLIKFDLSSLEGLYITDADLKMYQYHQYYYDQAMPTHIGLMRESWGYGTTWNILGDDGGQNFDAWNTKSVARGEWLVQASRSPTQDWVEGHRANYGFIVYQKTDGSEGQTYWRKFRSREYGTSTQRPRLIVDYEYPQAASQTDYGTYHVGDVVTTTVSAVSMGAADPDDITEFRMGVNRESGAHPDAADRRGVFGWFAEQPAAPWVSQPTANGGYVAYYDSTAYGIDHVEPLLDQCSINAAHSQATFAFRIKDNYGDLQDNDFDTLLKMDSGNSSWSSGWLHNDNNVDIQPSPIGSLEVSSSAGEWFAEQDQDSDGFADAGSEGEEGRGSISLSWSAQPLADGYAIELFDGEQFRQIGQTVGNDATSFSTADAACYPGDAAIAALTSGANPFLGAQTPGDEALVETLTPSGLAGAGLLAGDGDYLYVRKRVSYPGPAAWTKIDVRAGSGTYGQIIATVGPDLSAEPALSAFYLDEYIYNGYVTLSGGDASIEGQHRDTPQGQSNARTITFSDPPLDRTSGDEIDASTHTVLLACDGDHIYSAAASQGNGGGLNGYRIRTYELSGTPATTATLTDDQTIAMTSVKLSHLLVDGQFLYLGQWTNSSDAEVLRLAKDEVAVRNLWSVDQGQYKYCTGLVEPDAERIWLGHINEGTIYRYGGPGHDLRDDPNPLYVATDGSDYESATHYRLRVVPYNDHSGSHPEANTETLVALDQRSVHVREAPRHAVQELDSFAGHAASALLDEGQLELAISDLQIASHGPPAALDRLYSSAVSTSGGFAPGWRFGFESSLDFLSATRIDYLDGAGERYGFASDGGTWQPPNGLVAELTQDGSQWLLTFKDNGVLVFDSNGVLVEERDPNGNTTSYAYDGEDLTISAANGQSIEV